MTSNRRKTKTQTRVEDYRHDDQRLNNPPIGRAGYEPQVSEPEIKTYAYDPHLSPQLVWAGKPGLEEITVSDRAGDDVETLPRHIHERVSIRAIIDVVKRPELKQMDLFADPQHPPKWRQVHIPTTYLLTVCVERSTMHCPFETLINEGIVGPSTSVVRSRCWIVCTPDNKSPKNHQGDHELNIRIGRELCVA